MIKTGGGNRENGVSSPMLIVIIVILVVAAGGLGAAFYWAYGQRNHYKNDQTTAINNAVTSAVATQREADQKQCAIDNQKPYSTWTAPTNFGSVSFQYPRTWSAYVAQDGSDNNNYSVYFNPGSVPPTGNNQTPFALRLNIYLNQAYKDYIGQFQGNNELSVSPLTQNTTDTFVGYQGIRVNGQFNDAINGSVVVFPLRTGTIVLSVDSQQFVDNFNNIILPSLKFNE